MAKIKIQNVTEWPIVPGYLFAKPTAMTWTGRAHTTIRIPCDLCEHWHTRMDGFAPRVEINEESERHATRRPGDMIKFRCTCWALPGKPRRTVRILVQPEPFHPDWYVRSRGPYDPDVNHWARYAFTASYRAWLAEQSIPASIAA